MSLHSNLGVELDGGEDFFQMFWPVTVSHRINEDSELYELSSRDISCRYEVEILDMVDVVDGRYDGHS